MKVHIEMFRERREPKGGTGSARASIPGTPLAESVMGEGYVATVTLENGAGKTRVDLSDSTFAGISEKLAAAVSEAGRGNGATRPECSMRFAVGDGGRGTRTVAGSEAVVEVRYERSALDAAEITEVFRTVGRALAGGESG